MGNSLDGTRTKLEQLREERRKLWNELIQKAKDQAHEAFAGLFEKYSDLDSFAWPQYTPYFNDGDACHFGCYCEAYNMYINGDHVDDDDYYHD